MIGEDLKFEDNFEQDDGRTDEAKAFDRLNTFIDRLDEIYKKAGSTNSNNQNFTISNGGWVNILCACLAIICLAVTVIELARQDAALTRAIASAEAASTREKIATEGELHDLRAWSDIYRQRIQNLEKAK